MNHIVMPTREFIRLKDISLIKSKFVEGAWQLYVQVETQHGEFESTTYFGDMPGFLKAVADTATFFAVRMGRVTSRETKRLLVPDLAPNPDGAIR
jgi:hypothetical protein